VTFQLTESEWALVASVPLDDLVALAVNLDIVLEADFDRRQALEQCIPRIVARAREEGLPLSAYDRGDVEELSEAGRAALAALLRTRPTTDAILKAGAKVYKARLKLQPSGHDPYAYMIPLLLGPIVRAAASAHP
jgi:hypothetical protein